MTFEGLSWKHQISTEEQESHRKTALWLHHELHQPVLLNQPWWLVVTVEQGQCLWFLRNTKNLLSAQWFTGIYRKPISSTTWLKCGFSISELATFIQIQVMDTEQEPALNIYYQDGGGQKILGTQKAGILTKEISQKILHHTKQSSEHGYIGCYANMQCQLRISKGTVLYTPEDPKQA